MDIFEIISGIITIAFVIVNFILGFKIALTFRKRNDIEFIFVGISWFGIAFPLIPDVLVFVFNLTTPNIPGNALIILYAVFNIILIPAIVLLWLIALTNLLQVQFKLRRVILIIYCILSGILEILFFYFLITDISIIGNLGSNPYQVIWSSLSDIILVSNLIIVLLTGILFARVLLQSTEKEMILRGKLLMIAFITFVIGSLIDMVLTTAISNVIARSILILSSIEFYLGFIFPKIAQNILMK
ncbi:MAG: hypothetical protein GF317_14410 [Candidatus Lokiarchaeota archaeon]|nr:hypothetical protein [Candidatus Lokiarchaeota archaeon]MBD3200799.1 hypothetical protein [Candidatus Lokiarchaeota archaeon]